jgi:hypothetical protein
MAGFLWPRSSNNDPNMPRPLIVNEATCAGLLSVAGIRVQPWPGVEARVNGHRILAAITLHEKSPGRAE